MINRPLEVDKARELEKPSKFFSQNSINSYHIQTKKFKTNTINIFFHDDLENELASKNALIPAVLRRGTSHFLTFKDIALYMEELYGASFDCGVTKKGERQVIQFYIEFVSDKYAVGEELFQKAFDFLYDVITKPVLENGAFRSDYVQQEKENLKDIIQGRVNDKLQYAIDRCLEETCKDEPFGIYDYGSVEEIDKIDPQSLYQHYVNLIRTSPVDVYISGDVKNDTLEDVKAKLSNLRKEADGDIKVLKGVSPDSFNKTTVKQEQVTEKLDVNQGKLSLGFRTNTSPDSDDYYALMVYNGVLGGGVQSKLFQNVREKASLAYYVFSRLERYKGLMVISSGINIEDKDKALEIILDQMEQIKEGNVTDYEYETTLNVIETGIKSMRDSQLQIVDFYLSQSISGTDDDFLSIVEKVKKVSKEAVVKISQKIKLNTVYFLTTNREV